ncbi:LysR family transcriptional regulator [Austwickia chelonae]|uniref:Putative LysR family transcriptional regulator n=1 Tax=Austwickia chelonae NBRC 105200 TaxID=1184607 RepID=K6UP13_9MICO|nr:LysR family transcriptional regulator [Austwickia chelonae]GAB79436.1 putative LysR family transcriptional regulator [Austwickia chelonae NBRC 105200]
MLNPVHLQTLVTVVQTGSFVEAARELGYTPSAVSQQVAALERSLKLVLFDRAAHSISPTPTARVLADRSRDSLAALRVLEEDVLQMARGGLGVVRVGAFPTAVERLLPGAFALLLGEFPGVEVRLCEGETDLLVSELAEGRLDVAVVCRYDVVPVVFPGPVEVFPLLREDLLVVTPRGHRWAGRAVPWSELAQAGWVTAAENSPGANCLEILCASAGFTPNVVMRGSSDDALSEFVRCGLGVALSPGLCLGPSPDVGVARPTPAGASRRVEILRRQDAGPAANALVNALRQAAPSLSDPYVHSCD